MFQEYQKVTLPLPRPEEKPDGFNAFEEWARELHNKFEKEYRKIAFIINNCTARPEIGGLKTIDLFFLPPNTTSVLQPMDQGVICSLKARYSPKNDRNK